MYAVYITVNQANGTDFEMTAREYATHAELIDGLGAIVDNATVHCLESTTHGPSSIILTVVPQ
jgi:hypothetical protein